MTPTSAIDIVRRLAAGLEANDMDKLLERISVREDAEALRAALVEAGGRAVLGTLGTGAVNARAE